MFKVILVLAMVLIPALSFGQSQIYGTVTPYGAGSGNVYLYDSDGGSASITVYPDRSFTIDQTPGMTVQDLDRAHDETRRSIERLDRQLNGDH